MQSVPEDTPNYVDDADNNADQEDDNDDDDRERNDGDDISATSKEQIGGDEDKP